MTKVELYDVICSDIESVFSDHQDISGIILKMVPVLEREIRRKDKSVIQEENIISAIIDSSFRVGVAAAIDTIANGLNLSETDFDIFQSIKNRIEIEYHNCDNISNRSSF